MKGFINPDSKLFALLNKAILLVELNMLVLLCCLPVITAGAALCSMHSVLLKVYRDEENRIWSDFFLAMKSNLKNGSILWLLFLGYLGLLAGLGVLATRVAPAQSIYILYGLLLAAVIGVLYLNWALILQSRYVYTIAQCLKYALLAWMKYPGSNIVYPISLAIPVLLCCSIQTLPLVVFMGVTIPQMISTTLYSRVFDQMEGVPPRMPKL